MPLFVAQPAKTRTAELPRESGFISVKDFGAKGDGITDDTEALKKVFGFGKQDKGGSIRAIYIPNGVSLVSSNMLESGDKRKDVWGESRNGVIIKLKDNYLLCGLILDLCRRQA